jgi:hypothetical protein
MSASGISRPDSGLEGEAVTATVDTRAMERVEALLKEALQRR